MSATLFGDEIPAAKPKSKPLGSHQLIQHYHSVVLDRIELATSHGGILYGELDLDTFGKLLAVIDPDNFEKDNWRVGSRLELSEEDFADVEDDAVDSGD